MRSSSVSFSARSSFTSRMVSFASFAFVLITSAVPVTLSFIASVSILPKPFCAIAFTPSKGVLFSCAIFIPPFFLIRTPVRPKTTCFYRETFFRPDHARRYMSNLFVQTKSCAFIIVVKKENINSFDETKMSFLFILTFGRAAQVFTVFLASRSYAVISWNRSWHARYF